VVEKNMYGKLMLILAVVFACLYGLFWWMAMSNIAFAMILTLPMIACGFGFGLFLILGIVFLVIGK